MSATIKFNLNNEIRRITVQKQPTFEELSEILNRLYGNKLAKQTFALRYLDSEGDAVTVSSTEELEEAFRNFADRPIARFAVIPNEKEEDDDDDEEEENAEEQLRSFFSALLGVPPRQAKPACPLFAQRPIPCARPQQPAQEEKVAHHAFCDHCNSRIFGLRFKCAQCPDFDLCEKCFPSKNEKHDASHLFVRIARPYPPQFRYVRPSCVPKQETAKTEETKTESSPIKVEVTIPEEKTEEVKTEETVAITEPEPVKEAETVAEPVKEPEAVVAEPVKEEKKSPFEAKLEQLQDMGFADREKNIRILVKRSGDLAKAVRDLLE